MSRPTDRRGFTLVEVAFSIAIIGVAVVSAMALFGAGAKAMARARQQVAAAVTADHFITAYGAKFLSTDTINAATATNGSLSAAVVTGAGLISPSGPTLSLPEDDGTTKYALPASIGAGDPRWNLVFQFSNSVSNGTQSFRILRVWSCAWRSAPATVQIRGTLLGRFIYFDYN